MELKTMFIPSSWIIKLKNKASFCRVTFCRSIRASVAISFSWKPRPYSGSEVKDIAGFSNELLIASFSEIQIAPACFAILSAPYLAVQWLRYFKESTCRHTEQATKYSFLINAFSQNYSENCCICNTKHRDAFKLPKPLLMAETKKVSQEAMELQMVRIKAWMRMLTAERKNLV